MKDTYPVGALRARLALREAAHCWEGRGPGKPRAWPWNCPSTFHAIDLYWLLGLQAADGHGHKSNQALFCLASGKTSLWASVAVRVRGLLQPEWQEGWHAQWGKAGGKAGVISACFLGTSCRWEEASCLGPAAPNLVTAPDPKIWKDCLSFPQFSRWHRKLMFMEKFFLWNLRDNPTVTLATKWT